MLTGPATAVGVTVQTTVLPCSIYWHDGPYIVEVPSNFWQSQTEHNPQKALQEDESLAKEYKLFASDMLMSMNRGVLKTVKPHRTQFHVCDTSEGELSVMVSIVI